jgi:hypothetical protein
MRSANAFLSGIPILAICCAATVFASIDSPPPAIAPQTLAPATQPAPARQRAWREAHNRPTPIDAVSSAILDKARQILRDSKDSLYAHKTDIDESRGQYHCDCSGLADYILQQVSPAHYRLVVDDLRTRPLARHFYRAFVNADNHPIPGQWQRIDRLIDARPGDLLVWRRVSLKPGQSTGHVMIVNQPPVSHDDDTIGVEIIDSTGSGHANDTRAKGQTGIGRGTIYFDIDPAGRPIAYHWRNPDAQPTPAPIAIGRALGPVSSPGPAKKR